MRVSYNSRDGSHFCDWPGSLALQSTIVKHLSKSIKMIAQNFAGKLRGENFAPPYFLSTQKSFQKISIPIN